MTLSQLFWNVLQTLKYEVDDHLLKTITLISLNFTHFVDLKIGWTWFANYGIPYWFTFNTAAPWRHLELDMYNHTQKKNLIHGMLLDFNTEDWVDHFESTSHCSCQTDDSKHWRISPVFFLLFFFFLGPLLVLAYVEWVIARAWCHSQGT